MDKYEKQIEDCYKRLKCTLERCGGVLEAASDEELLRLMYEDLVIDVRCDLCDANLENLLEHNYIYPEIAQRIVRLRENMVKLMNAQRMAVKIRGINEWKTAAEGAADITEMLYI